MNPYEHAQQPTAPSGLPIAGSPPPAYDPNQGYAPPNSYEYAPPVAYEYGQAPPPAAPGYGYGQAQPAGYEQAYQQAATPAYPQTPDYHQSPGYQQPPPSAYQQPFGYQQPPSGPPSGPPAYIITPGAPGTVVKKSGGGKKLALIALVVLVVAGGGAAFAADAWAKGQVCDAVQGLGDDTSKSGSKKGTSDEPTVAELDAAEKGLNGRADLLLFHGDLKEATHDLADDVDTLKTMVAKGPLDDPDAKTVTQLLALAASLDNHARKAQRACGLPEKSLMGTTA
jgi:hypothetical protein